MTIQDIKKLKGDRAPPVGGAIAFLLNLIDSCPALFRRFTAFRHINHAKPYFTRPSTQTTLDIPVTPAQPSEWDLCRQHTTIAGLQELMEWCESTSKTQFTPREARADKKLRPLFDSADDIRNLFEVLVEYGLLTSTGEDIYARSPLS